MYEATVLSVLFAQPSWLWQSGKFPT